MDTDDFIVSRRQLVDRLETRRSREMESYPFRAGGSFSRLLPGWARIALSFLPRGGLATAFLGTVVPFVAPFVLEKKSSLPSRLIDFLKRI